MELVKEATTSRTTYRKPHAPVDNGSWKKRNTTGSIKTWSPKLEGCRRPNAGKVIR